MRILQVTEASWAGTLGVVTALSDRLAAAGHEVALVYAVRPETAPDLPERVSEAVELVPLDWRRRSPRSHAALALALRRLVSARRPDVVHLHSSFAGAIGSLAATGVPKVYTPHGYVFARRPQGGGVLTAYRGIERLVARRCDVVAAVSEAEATLARGLGAPRVEVVPNGIPGLDAPVQPAPARPEPRVVALGRIGPARRPEASARILAAVAGNAEVRWIGAAGGDEDAPLRAAGIPVTGWLDHRAALDELGRATVLLHYSERDGASLAVLEAVARDVLVIASDIPANRELLGPRQVFADEAGAAAAIQAALRDPGLRAELLASQRARCSGRGADRMTRLYADLYQRCALSPRPLRRWSHVGDGPTIERRCS
ncbi:MAG TPA: glycosyltransferase [Thermoleophilaceae bacterium]|nr:glycosyltransferase [Thermoleophilaceae bacterium]